MADFEKAYSRTSIFEGGYSSIPDDNGNWTGGKKGSGILVGTNYGISAPDYAAYMGKNPSILDMKNMPIEVAKSIYKKKYWAAIRGDEINNQDTANGIYDMAVNGGIGTSIILAKRAANVPENTKMDDAFLNILNQKTA